MSPRPPESPRPDRPGVDRFEEALRAWASREPTTPPAEAARRVLRRLPERGGRRVPHGRRWWLAAAVLALAALAWAAVLGRNAARRPPQPLRAEAPPTPPEVVPATGAVPVAPSGDVLVIALDPETTLYLTLDRTGDRS